MDDCWERSTETVTDIVPFFSSDFESRNQTPGYFHHLTMDSFNCSIEDVIFFRRNLFPKIRNHPLVPKCQRIFPFQEKNHSPWLGSSWTSNAIKTWSTALLDVFNNWASIEECLMSSAWHQESIPCCQRWKRLSCHDLLGFPLHAHLFSSALPNLFKKRPNETWNKNVHCKVSKFVFTVRVSLFSFHLKSSPNIAFFRKVFYDIFQCKQFPFPSTKLVECLLLEVIISEVTMENVNRFSVICE